VTPWILLDTATVPDGGELKLKRRGDELSIMLGSNELMNSRVHGSEDALATLAAQRIAGRARPRVLIGGLGMGFTLRAALAALPTDAEIVVVEIVPAVVRWARGPMADLFDGSLDDPRATIREADVHAEIAAARGAFDAILLDVDNGPDGLSRDANDALYSVVGLGHARAALRPGGVLAVWSAHPSPAFARRLRAGGFAVEEVGVPARGRAKGRKGGPRHTIWLATKR
jgi:spermidine synthase